VDEESMFMKSQPTLNINNNCKINIDVDRSHPLNPHPPTWWMRSQSGRAGSRPQAGCPPPAGTERNAVLLIHHWRGTPLSSLAARTQPMMSEEVY
jgi:hypothetical protein